MKKGRIKWRRDNPYAKEKRKRGTDKERVDGTTTTHLHPSFVSLERDGERREQERKVMHSSIKTRNNNYDYCPFHPFFFRWYQNERMENKGWKKRTEISVFASHFHPRLLFSGFICYNQKSQLLPSIHRMQGEGESDRKTKCSTYYKMSNK